MKKSFLARWIAIPLMIGLFAAYSPSVAQEEQPKEEVREPVPVNELPPLNLPDLPSDKDDPIDTQDRPDIPEPPAPRPEPKGPAVVKAGIQPTGSRFFKLFYDGKPIGWSMFRISGQMKLGETDALILNSAGELRVGFENIVPSKFEAKLMIDRNSLRPGYFKCVQATGQNSFQVECVYADSMVAQTNQTGDNRAVHFHNFEGKPPQLVFNNLWGHLDTFPEHYWLMVRSAVNGGRVPTYDPILRGEGEVIVYPPKSMTYNLDGRELAAKAYDVTDIHGVMLASVTVAADSFELLEVEEIGSGLKMVKTTPGVEGRLKDLAGLDLTGARIVESNVVFPDPEQLTALEADVNLDLRGGQLADHRIAGYRQYFTGELREGLMKGRVFVRSVPREIPFDTLYPLDDKVPEEYKKHLLAGPGVELEFPMLATKAREIAWKSPTTFDAAKRLNSYVYNLEEGVSLPSARYALETGVGNPESKALLLVAMNRAVKLPARKISGIAFRDGFWVPHHWVEVWLGESIGWTPFDPSTGEAGRVGAAHIALLDSGDIQNIDIRVTDYAPRATKRVPYIAQELQWSVGEKRTYGVYIDGKKVGTESAAVGDIELVDGEELYSFTAQSEIDTGKGRQITRAEQFLTPQGLPRKIVLEYIDPLESKTTTFDFAEDTVIIRPGKEGDEDFEESQGREYPFAKGTYFTDPRLLSHWALLGGQVPMTKDAEKEFPIHYFLPEKGDKREMLLEVGEKEEVTLEPGLSIDRRDDKTEDETEGSESEDSTKGESAEGEATDEKATPTESQTSEVPPAEDKTAEEKPDEEPSQDDPVADEEQPEGNSITADPLSTLPTSPTAKVQLATPLLTDTGIEFWLNDRNQIIKIAIPDQGIELILEKVETTL
jgi:transglutaminase-like putative cysteine protease